MTEGMRSGEREISFGALALRVLLRRKLLVAVGLIAAVIGGGLRAVKLRGGTQTDRAAFGTALANYQNTRDSLDAEISSLEEDLREKQTYLDESIYANLNDYNLCEGSAALYISGAKDQETAELLASYYQNVLQGGIDWSGFDRLGTDVKDVYLNELLFAERDGASVRVSVLYSDEEGAGALIDYVMDQIGKNKQYARQHLGTHDLAVLGRKVAAGVRADYMDRPYTRTYDLQEINMTIKALTAMREDLKKPSASGTGGSLKKIIKSALLAFVGGVCALALILAVRLCAQDVLLAPSDLRKVFGLRLLAVDADKAGGPVRGGIRSLDPDLREALGAEKPYGAAAELIAAETREKPLVALIGDAEEDRFREASERLLAANPKLCCRILGQVKDNPDALAALREAGGAVLIAETEKTTFRGAEAEIAAAADRAVPLLGTIVFDR